MAKRQKQKKRKGGRSKGKRARPSKEKKYGFMGSLSSGLGEIIEVDHGGPSKATSLFAIRCDLEEIEAIAGILDASEINGGKAAALLLYRTATRMREVIYGPAKPELERSVSTGWSSSVAVDIDREDED